MVTAVVLAAGASRRYGEPKLVLPFRGEPLLRRTIGALLDTRVDGVVVVVPPGDTRLRGSLQSLDVRCVDAETGDGEMSASLRAGVAAAIGSDAIVIALGDQPTVPPGVVDRLIDAWTAGGRAIVAPRYDGVRGNPVLFDASLVPELMAVRGDRGAREVVARDASRVDHVAFPFAMPADVDTREDYERLLRGG